MNVMWKAAGRQQALALRDGLGRWLLTLALAGSLFLGTGPAQAAPIPFGDQPVHMIAREQPIDQFLRDFFGTLDIPVSVSASVTGAVNGEFSGAAQEIFAGLQRSFSLLAYYDGAVVYVYTPAEVATRTFSMRPGHAQEVIATAREMRLPDRVNTLRVSQSGGLIASGSQRFVELVGELASGQQSQATALAPLGFKVYYLRYAWAHDVAMQTGGKTTVIPGVARILRSLLTSQSGSQAPALTQYRDVDEQSLRGQGLARRGDGTLGGRGADPMQVSFRTVEQAWGNGVDGALDLTSMDGRLLDRMDAAAVAPDSARVEADARLNAVIVRDLPERLPFYDELIESLDVEPQAVEIEATIIDLNTRRLRELGINWRLSGDRYSLLFGSGGNSDFSLSGNVPAADITPSGQGGFLSLVLGGRNNFIARINALQDQGVARVVSSPQVMTLSNVEALFDTTQSMYVRVAGREEVDLFKISAGTTLRVTPHVFRDHDQVRIKLLVQIEDGKLEFDSAHRVDAIPVVARSSINTQALIQAGESLLIGGMNREATMEGVTKVPLLGDIPVVGNLFKYRDDQSEYVERLFLISPRLIPAQRRVDVAAITTGPQRPGRAVEAPPMPEMDKWNWNRQGDGDASGGGGSRSPERSHMPASGEFSM